MAIMGSGLILLVVGKAEEKDLTLLPCNATNHHEIIRKCSIENCNGKWCRPINCENNINMTCCSVKGLCENNCIDHDKWSVKYILNDGTQGTVDTNGQIEDIKCWRDERGEIEVVNNNPKYRVMWMIGAVFFPVGLVSPFGILLLMYYGWDRIL